MHWSRIHGVLGALVLLAACGNEVASGNAGTINCSVGETVLLDSNGNPYCGPAGGGGTIADGTGSLDSAGAADTGAGSSDATGSSDGTGGGNSDGSGSSDASGGDSADDATPTDPWLKCPPVKGTGLEHGKKCATHEECMYGYCMKGGFLTGYDDTISYCTKNNACTGSGSFTTAPCDYDDDASKSLTFKSAFEKSKSGGNDKRTSSTPFKVCARTCKADSECEAWNAEMPHCIINSTKYVSVGTQGVCGHDPLR